MRTLEKVIQGMELTEKYTPDIEALIETFKDMDLPSRVAFGSLDPDKKKEP
ncbi:hypothetical protein LJK88_05140 [Paenibacillus sp. P26]|nr:hypothetical protein LJK88_05140 [Paenibacillus sp. P26]